MGLATTADNYSMPYTDDERVEEAVEMVSEETELDLDVFDGFMVDPHLPDNIQAQTVNRYIPDQYGGFQKASYMVVNDDFFDLPEEDQMHVALHEKIHGLDFKYGIENVLKEKHGISEDLYDQLSDLKGDSRDVVEGMTEALTQKLDPNDSHIERYVYPYRTRAFEELLEDEGIDLNEELLEADADNGYDFNGDGNIEILPDYVSNRFRYNPERREIEPVYDDTVYQEADAPDVKDFKDIYGVDPDNAYLDALNGCGGPN